MARQNQRWTLEEEEALRAGVEKYGTSRWKVILSDPEFASALANRSNVDLKDKWRNLSVPGGSRERVKTPRSQGLSIDPSPESLSAVPLLEYDHAAEPSQSSEDKKAPLACKAMIFEALSSTEDSNGLDVNAILSYIERKYEVPQNFRRPLTRDLTKLVSDGKLEKVNDCYKIKGERHNDEESASIATETLEDAARYAAYAIAVDDNALYDLDEAYKEAGRLEKLARENMGLLKLANDLREECESSPVGYILVNPKGIRFER